MFNEAEARAGKVLEGDMSQVEQIYQYMKAHGSITPIEALEHCGCFRLAARVYDLRRAGFAIVEDDINENGKTFARYRFATEPKQLEMAI